MRYFLLLAMLGCALPGLAADLVSSPNESVAAISYNPSRLGAYSHLKIVKAAQLYGGIDATDADVNIMSAGTVEITNTGNTCNPSEDENCYRIANIKPIASNPTYCATHSDWCDTSSSENFRTSLVTEKGTIVQRKQSSGEYLNKLPNDIEHSAEFPVSPGIDVEIKGGTLQGTGGSSDVIFVNSLVGALEKTQWDAGRLILESQTMKITDYFTLGGITIPKSEIGSFSKFEWAKRIDSKGREVWVLGVK